ncbi:MAG: hypothetical protein WAM39_07795 [Bryobacteraceae bacterium]
MKSNIRLTLLLSLAAVCFTSGSLRAADLTGSFTLPSETHWGLAVLPAGDYTFTYDRMAHHCPVISVSRGNKVVAVILNQESSLTSTSGGSSMQIEGNRVRTLHLAPLGETYYYPVPKREKEVLARGSSVAAAVVSIAAK